MTHVHEWVLTILETSKEALEKAGSDSMIPVMPAAICECEERLLPTEVERHLNAMGRLKKLIVDLQEANDGPNEMGGPFVSLSVIAAALEDVSEDS